MDRPPHVIFTLISLVFQLSTHQNKSSYWKTTNVICPGVRFSKDPETFRGSFRVNFSSPEQFVKAPENTPDSHPSFSGCFLGFVARAWWWSGLKKLNWHHCVGVLTYSPNQNFPWKITGKLQFLLSFAHFQHHLSYVASPLSGIKSLKKVWCKY